MIRHSLPLLALFLALPSFAGDDKPIPPTQAAGHMTLPEGFRATLFAGEPDVVQPIAFTFDDRGRLWVVEGLAYPKWSTTGEGKDRILIFEDKDGDGHFDSCKVFYDKGVNLSGIQVGFGGVWLVSTPNLVFIPDRNGDDVPDGPPEVLLDGWDLNSKHNVASALTWGPDGWLYGCNGILGNSLVGKPGTPADKRVPFNCGVWRYHPTRHVFEPVAWGTTNPWGLDFDDHGQMFITNCVISHLWHVVPGAHFQRMYGEDFNKHVYDLMPSIADHIHWGGGPWGESRGGKGVHDKPGGGHAHVGCMVYLGDNWPDRYRNTVFMCNIHGNRVNNDVLERRGSTYVAHHGADFLFANDPWFRGVAVQYGPDGGVFVSDWCDTGECHNYEVVDRSNGRIYKVTYGQTKPFREDLAKLDDPALVRKQLHANAWHGGHARRLLQERAAAGKLAVDTRDSLLKMLKENPDVTHRLRALWALYTTGGVEEKLLTELLGDPEESVRAWAIQLGLEDRRPSAAVRTKLAEMARQDPSPMVRLNLASGVQRLSPSERWAVVEGLVGHGEDVKDLYLPLMNWYAVEPLFQADASRFAELIAKSSQPLVREYVARLTAEEPNRLAPLVRLLDGTEDVTAQADVLRGMHDALAGRRHVAMPAGWDRLAPKLSGSSDPQVRETARFLAVLFDDPKALADLRQTVRDAQAKPADRMKALEALVFKNNADIVPFLFDLLADPAVRGPAMRGLANFADPETPRRILAVYPKLTDEDKADAIQTLSSRPAYALALLEALGKGPIPRRDVSAFTIRQLLELHDAKVSDRITQVWGTLRPASQEKAALTTRYKALLTPDSLKSADRSHGRLVFRKTCASCHYLFDDGGKIGPELTGSQRANLDYILDNVLDPSAVVPRDYQVTLIQTRDGRLVSGIIKQENDHAVTVQTQNEIIRVPKAEIEERTKSPLSMMPEGLFAQLTNDEVRDLVAYLASPSQVPLPKEDNHGSNGKKAEK